MITEIYSHRHGDEVVPNKYVAELRKIIGAYQKKLGLYKISDFKQYLLPAIKRSGWTDEYYLDYSSKITITSVKDGIGLCIQTGNMARVYADLIKLQALYVKEGISGGILVLALSECGKSFGGNVATYERVIRELKIFDKVITMPLMVIGFSNEN